LAPGLELAAVDFGPRKDRPEIHFEGQGGLVDGGVEAGPARSRIKFGVGREKGGSASAAGESSWFFHEIEFGGVWGFRAVFAEDGELFGG